MFIGAFWLISADLPIPHWIGRWSACVLCLALGLFALGAGAAPFAGEVIRGVAYGRYTPVDALERTVHSNVVRAVVTPVEEFFLTPDQTMGGLPGATVVFRHVLTNKGNGRSDYRFALDQGGCFSMPSFSPGGRLFLDVNSNGEVDGGDREVPWGQASALNLLPESSANLLLQVQVPPSLNVADYCARLGVVTDITRLQRYSLNRVRISALASLRLGTSVAVAGAWTAGKSALRYRIVARNVGRQIAGPTPVDSSGVALRVDGVGRPLILLRVPLPAETLYVPDSLRHSDPGAQVLYRLAGDAPHSYRSMPGPHPEQLIEVALGLSRSIAVNEQVRFEFSTRLKATGAVVVKSQSHAIFHNGSRPDVTSSNLALVRTLDALGLSVAANAPSANVDVRGQFDGTATVRFSVMVRNHHANHLHGLRISNPLEQVPGGLGRYTAAATPRPGEYTVVQDSLRIVAAHGDRTVAEVDPAFTGQSAHAELLRSQAKLASGGMVNVQFDVRFHLSGVPPVLYNSATAFASTQLGGAGVFAHSVNGLDPALVSLSGPGVPSEATPYSTDVPIVTLRHTMQAPRPVAGMPGAYDLDFALDVANVGSADVAHLRLVSNLDCAFQMGAENSRVQRWQLVAAPKSEKGLLVPVPTFTGKGRCDDPAPEPIDAVAAFPLQTEVAVVDGPIAFPAGQSDTLRFTVRVTMKSAEPAAHTAFSHRAWVGVMQTLDQKPVDQLPSRNDGHVAVLWATMADAGHVQVIPTGVVYNAVTRQPVADARVILARQMCHGSDAGAIDAGDLAGDTSGHTFHADGSVSARTDAQGRYYFVLDPKTTRNLCTYSVQVESPAGSNLVFPSTMIPAQTGAFSACGAVAPSAAAPQQGQDTTYFYQLVQGAAPGTDTACHAFYNHIPLDPGVSRGLRLQKKAGVATAEFGEVVDYTLTVANDTVQDLPLVTLEDWLPPGFRLVRGSVRIAGQVQADPDGGVGPRLNFQLPALGAGATASLHYQARIGVGASLDQDAVNRAWAVVGVGPTALRSNEANARVHVLGGVFSDDAFAFGKVFLDCNRNGLQDAAEEGIPGVRLFMEDGVGVVTDSEGKWSLYGLRPVTHVLRLDSSTLPSEATLADRENRQAGQADSVFLDLQRGAWHKANFAVQNCDNPRVRQAVKDRRAALRDQPNLSDDGARAAVRLVLDAGRSNQIASRHGPSAGTVESQGVRGIPEVPVGALIALQAPSTGPVPPVRTDNVASEPPDRTVRQVVVVAPPEAERTPDLALEEALQGMDSTLDLLNLHDQQVLTSALSNVRVKGRAGTQLALLVNGLEVDQTRVGKRVRIEHLQVEAWEYIAVPMAEGENTLEVQERDPFGNVRGAQALRVYVPGALAHIALDLAATAPADAGRPVPVELRLLDQNQWPVMARTAITLEATGARWEVDDLNPQEPGIQLMVEGGHATLSLTPPTQPGDGHIRVSAGDLQTDAKVIFLPDLRPISGIGILEGIVKFNPGTGVPVGAARAGEAFESELRAWSFGGSDDAALAGRSAFYFKGAVKGEYLLTLAYDNDKRTAFRMFRDIQPDQYYPVYGDSSVKHFDAQSSQRLYVRVDKDRSYLLYGDHGTASSPEVRKLSQVAHNATGVKHVYSGPDLRISSHVSHDALKQYVEEFPARGTSGPYGLNTPGDLFANSEIVEIVVRDRNQPNTILRKTQLTRFAQYTIEPLSQTILFAAPVGSLDADLNPQSIRITYAVDDGGPSFWTGGVDLQYKWTDKLQLGAVAAYEGAPDNALQLAAATALAKLNEETVLRVEAVETQSDLRGRGQGVGLRLEDAVGALKYALRLHTSDAGFHNPYAGVAAGQTDLGARAEYVLDANNRLKADLTYTRVETPQTHSGADDGVRARGAGFALQRVLTPYLTSEVGLRAGQSALGAVSSFDYGAVSSGGAAAPASLATYGGNTAHYVSARGRLTFKPPALPAVQLFAEGEQDVHDPDRQLAALGGNYAISAKTRLYGRYEVISSAGSSDALARGLQRNVGLLGIDSSYMEGGRVYDEVRIADTMDGRALQSAMGVRNSWPVTDGLRLSAGLEKVSALPGSVGTVTGASHAWTGAFDWLGQGAYLRRLRASGAVEWREGDDTHSRLLSAGLAYKWNRDWSVLTRGIYSRMHQVSDSVVHDKRRAQIGLAYRPVDHDAWNALWRYEQKVEHRHTVQSVTDIVSTHLHYQPAVRDRWGARVAFRKNYDIRDAVPSTYGAALWHGRWTHDLSAQWDFGLQAGLWVDDRGATRNMAGAELGYQLGKGMWLSVGYNVLGLRDPDLSGADYTDTGLYLRLRFKFDERLFLSGTDAAPEFSNQVN